MGGASLIIKHQKRRGTRWIVPGAPRLERRNSFANDIRFSSAPGSSYDSSWLTIFRAPLPRSESPEDEDHLPDWISHGSITELSSPRDFYAHIPF